jgi:hypothetical protein
VSLSPFYTRNKTVTSSLAGSSQQVQHRTKPSIKPACGWEHIKIRNDYRKASNDGVMNNQFSYPRLYGVGVKKDSSTLNTDASVPSEEMVPVYNTTRRHMLEDPDLPEEISLEIKFISVSTDQIRGSFQKFCKL